MSAGMTSYRSAKTTITTNDWRRTDEQIKMEKTKRRETEKEIADRRIQLQCFNNQGRCSSTLNPSLSNATNNKYKSALTLPVALTQLFVVVIKPKSSPFLCIFLLQMFNDHSFWAAIISVLIRFHLEQWTKFGISERCSEEQNEWKLSMKMYNWFHVSGDGVTWLVQRMH